MTPADPCSQSAEPVLQILAESIGALVDALHCPEHVPAARAVVATTADAIRQYFTHVHWPSRMTASGFPLEISLATAPGAAPAVRTLLDLSDHRFPLSANRDTLIAHAARLVWRPPEQLAPLFDEMSQGSDENSRTPVNHGSGYAPDGRTRGSLYFFIGGSESRPFAQRFPAMADAVHRSLDGAGGVPPRRFHSVSFDFDPTGTVTRQKVYGWFVGRDVADVRAALGRHADLRRAVEFTEVIAQIGPIRIDDGAVLFQSSQRPESMDVRHKAYINLQGWDVEPRDALLASLVFASRAGVDVTPLEVLLEAFSSRGVRLHPSWIAVGPGPAMTWYFVPDVGVADLSPGAVAQARERLIEHLLAQRLADGSWAERPGEPADARTTARVTATLARLPSLAPALQRSAAWLRDRRARGEDDPSVTLPTLDALRALGDHTAWHRPVAIDRLAPSELALAATLAMDGVLNMPAEDVVHALRAQARPQGGWARAGGDVLAETADVMTLLAPRAESAPLTRHLRDAAFRFSDDPVSAGRLQAAHWLRGWIASGLDPQMPSLVRALACLTTETRDEPVATTAVVLDALVATSDAGPESP